MILFGFLPPIHSFTGKLLDKNWIGFVDKALHQKNNLNVTVHTRRDCTHRESAHTKKLWRALLI